MSTMIRPTSPATGQPGRLLGARQLAEVVRRVAASPAEWLTRVRLNPVGRWYERIHLDDSHEVWVISWLPGQATGFHDHGGSAGAFTVVLGTLMERRVVGGEDLPDRRQDVGPVVRRRQGADPAVEQLDGGGAGRHLVAQADD